MPMRSSEPSSAPSSSVSCPRSSRSPFRRGSFSSVGDRSRRRPARMTGATEPDRLPAVAAALRLAASRFGTPLYLTDVATLDAAATAVRDAFPDPWLRQYSVKANDVAAIVRLVADRGFG